MGRWTYRAGALDKGKPAERRGRNATGPTLVNEDGKASRATWRTSSVVMAGGPRGGNTGSFIHCHHKETQSDAAEAHRAAPEGFGRGLHPHRAHGRRAH